ncbi:DUF6651 domain-containing protein [Pseudomonas sp. S9]|uniref:DUF6651 domain-containing protein n=1 Tax=Pseudomonas sp. S9 TaxID=686578 RepID=UPI0002556F4B|nr:DUF6651 domain-containing protein [Pseudomonas sp. S9]
MKLKLDEQGHAVLQDGKPVYVHDDGKEVAFDAPGTVATITRLNGEAKTHRERAESAEGKLKGFEGIEDGAAARKALEIVANLDQKKLVDAGQVEQVKAEAIKAVRAEYEPVVAERDKYKTDLYNEMIGGNFSRSKFAEEKVAVPRHMLQKTYGDSFKIEEGKVVAYDGNGAKIFSRSRPGELADFDEALELLISNDPYRDNILKGSGANGSGAPSGGGGNGGKATMTRAQFSALGPAEQATAAREATITD